MSRLENADPWRSFVFQPGCRSYRCESFLKFRGKLLCASWSRRPSAARLPSEKGEKRSTQLSRSRIRRKSGHLCRTPDISSAPPRCVRKDGSSIGPCVDGKSKRRCSSDNCALRRNCCRAVRWKNRADLKTESSARVFRADSRSPAIICRKELERSFLFDGPGEDRQFRSTSCAT